MARVNKYALAIDKLEITYKKAKKDGVCIFDCIFSEAPDNRHKEPEDVILDCINIEEDTLWLQRRKSVWYDYEYEIWCTDLDVNNNMYPCQLGLLFWGHVSELKKDIYISFRNDALYTRWMVDSRFYIEEMLGLKFYQVRKIDLCIDFNFNIQRRIVKALRNLDYKLVVYGRVQKDARVEGLALWAWDNPRWALMRNPAIVSARQYHEGGLNGVNKKNNNIPTLKTYDKKNEIEKSNKYYILDSAGFKNVVYRIEVSCKNHKTLAMTLKNRNLNFTDEYLYRNLQNEDVLLRLFNSILFRIVHLKRGNEKRGKLYSILEIALQDIK